MTIDAGTLITITLFLSGAIIGAYAFVFKRTKDTEDCVESELAKTREALRIFREDVIDRLARIETKIEDGAKKGASGSHPQ